MGKWTNSGFKGWEQGLGVRQWSAEGSRDHLDTLMGKWTNSGDGGWDLGMGKWSAAVSEA